MPINKIKEKSLKIIKHKVFIRSSIGVGVFLFVSSLFFVGAGWWYEDKVYPGVMLGSENLGGKTLSMAEIIVKQKFDDVNNGFAVNCADKKVIIKPVVVSADGVVAIELYQMNKEATWQKIVSLGRDGSFLNRLSTRLDGTFSHSTVEWEGKINTSAIAEYLKTECSEKETAVKDADINWKNNNWEVSPEVYGKTFNYQKYAEQISSQLSNGNLGEMTMELETVEPKIFSSEVQKQVDSLANKFSTIKLTLTYDKKKWVIKENDFKTWVATSWPAGSNLTIEFDQEKIKNYLKEKIAPEVDVKPELPKFEMKNGRATAFNQAKDGLELDVTSSSVAIIEAINQASTTVALQVKNIKEEGNNEEALLNGIKELIGVGKSNFAGSSANRRYNIANGAKAINGLIIKPGEEFSLLAALGEIDGENGYRKELVIKESKTIAEYGGGLCQVATTLFRAAYNSGLPITQRRNHSYRVQYYEPAGTDAAVYDPSPDMKFKNDTGNNILIQTRIVGNDAIFEFWGTDDGRKVEYTKPVIFNIVRPPAGKLIETDSLPAGQKKCTERAHNGADAYFDYKVTYADGTEKSTRFKSHYVPWQEVCLIGKAADKTVENATSTTAVESN